MQHFGFHEGELRVSARNIALTAVFTLFLWPVDFDGFSMNYSYMAFPALIIASRGAIRVPPRTLLAAMGIYMLIFMAASARDVLLPGDQEARRAVSFIFFMGIFSFAFIKIDASMLQAFKSAILMACAVHVSVAIVQFLALDSGGMANAKNMIGTQRFGFVYMMAFWIAYFRKANNFSESMIRLLLIVAMLCGLLLTFSRASIVALLVTVVAYFAVRCGEWLKRPSGKVALDGLLLTVLLAALITVLRLLFPTVFDYFDDRLVQYLADPSAVAEDFGNSQSSGGTRLYIFERGLEFLASRPFVGSGYLGVWILDDPLFGSAHNQFFDVLFRTGILGFIVYLALLLQLAARLHKRLPCLFWGVAGVLVYGLFHETFKESQGSFLLAFLLGALSQTWQEADSQVSAPVWCDGNSERGGRPVSRSALHVANENK